jgi:hypothetical protein
MRSVRNWTRMEIRLESLANSVEKLVVDKDRVHNEIVAREQEVHNEMLSQMREDRNATNLRLRWLEEHLWNRNHGS